MTEMGISRHADDFGVQCLELIDAVAEGNDFGGADECTEI